MSDAKKIKLVIIGEEKTGKTLFIEYLIKGHSSLDFNNYIPSKGARYNSKKYNYNNVDYELALWDTAGAEKYRSLTKFFIRESDIILIFFNYNNKRSFEGAKQLVELGKVESQNDKVVRVLVGNKYDLKLEPKTMDIVNEEDALDIAEVNNILFAHISIKEKYSNGINELLKKAFKEYVKKHKQ